MSDTYHLDFETYSEVNPINVTDEFNDLIDDANF